MGEKVDRMAEKVDRVCENVGGLNRSVGESVHLVSPPEGFEPRKW
jgi:hypothetical protein